MKTSMVVNDFIVKVCDGYPYWTEISYRGEQIARIHHKEMKDLEYALSRCRDQLRAVMPTSEKDEA